jgi:hypothetical protein
MDYEKMLSQRVKDAGATRVLDYCSAARRKKNESDGQRLALALLRKTKRESDKSTNGNNSEERIRVKER